MKDVKTVWISFPLLRP